MKNILHSYTILEDGEVNRFTGKPARYAKCDTCKVSASFSGSARHGSDCTTPHFSFDGDRALLSNAILALPLPVLTGNKTDMVRASKVRWSLCCYLASTLGLALDQVPLLAIPTNAKWWLGFNKLHLADMTTNFVYAVKDDFSAEYDACMSPTVTDPAQ